MAYLGNSKNTLEIVKKYNLSIQKKFGQNFLIDSNVLEGIVEASGITKDDCVLEIGPGIGTMTQYLAENAREVVSIEIDKALIPILKDTLSEYNNVTIINNDVLKTDIEEIVREHNGGKPVKVVANLPYYITTPIIMRLFEEHLPIDSITVMVQKEVADRMETGPGSKDYGALSLAVQYYAKPSTVMVVPPSSFIPQPGVSSEIIHLECYKELPVTASDEELMFRIIRAAFNQRRKTMLNSVSSLGEFSKADIQSALEKMGLSSTVRGEALSLEEFAAFSDLLKASKVQ
ncbi:MAG: 16S rRNA (adenine(1518)-N(6)/adenine(1519)-N(6))-dimethyltransferase RsmA [Butyrivibrio sp.]|nr:16S rRNA (adenine(1518)-N(6)/adenine(1519)-N(6))-dimethyltransferase RsmA [Butyrivibrio sp.]